MISGVRRTRRPNPVAGDCNGEYGCLLQDKREISQSLKEIVQSDFSPTGKPLPRLILQKALAGRGG